MLLTISTTHRPATDLGYLLGKNPARVQTKSLAFGAAHVVYVDARDDLCTAEVVARCLELAGETAAARALGEWLDVFVTHTMRLRSKP